MAGYSGYHPNYTDGVPVKISERFKPPPKLSLPQSVIAKLSKGPSSLKEDNYDFNYERIILARTSELQNLRIRDRHDRQERIRLREQQRLQQIEQEQKKKLNEVSYPSTDDLNSISDDEYHENHQKEIASRPQIPQIVRAAEVLSPSMFDTILMPTVLPRSSPTIEDATHPVVKKTHRRYPSQLDYAYFEADNSSPFDNMELKTINDLDILAQVLHQASTDQSPPENNLERNNSSESESASENPPVLNNNNISDLEPQQERQELKEFKDVAQPMYIQQSNYVQHHSYQYPQYGSYGSNYANFGNIPSLNSVNNQQSQQNYYPVGVPAQNYMSYAPNYQNYNWAANGGFEINKTVNNNVITDKQTVGFLQSKSVPDIMKELNDELNNSENRRVRNNSQTSHSQRDEAPVASHPKHLKNSLDERFRKLSLSSQQLAKSISSMGFPLELVIRVADKMGSDDKKIVEHLIPLSELLVLGFDESRISDALIKFNNNKDKALDFLIS